MARKNSHATIGRETEYSSTNRKFSPSPEVVWLTGLRFLSICKPLGDICQRFPNFPKNSNSNSPGLQMTEKIDVLTGKKWIILIKNHRNWQNLILSFDSWSARLKSGSQTRHSSFSILLIFSIWPFSKKYRGQFGKVYSNKAENYQFWLISSLITA